MRLMLLVLIALFALYLFFLTIEPTSEAPVSPPKQIPLAAETKQETADATAAATNLFAELMRKLDDQAVENAELLILFGGFKSQQAHHLAPVQRFIFDKAAERLAHSIELYENALARDDDSRLTLIERLGLWHESQFDRLSEHDQAYVKEQRERYLASIHDYASITGTDNFLASKQVSERMPVGVSDHFSGPTVWIWARVNAPRNEEKLTLKWLAADGTVLKVVSAKVSKNTGKGYRIYYYKNFYTPGAYEARLYNSQHHLIGLRQFQVSPGGAGSP